MKKFGIRTRRGRWSLALVAAALVATTMVLAPTSPPAAKAYTEANLPPGPPPYCPTVNVNGPNPNGCLDRRLVPGYGDPHPEAAGTFDPVKVETPSSDLPVFLPQYELNYLYKDESLVTFSYNPPLDPGQVVDHAPGWPDRNVAVERPPYLFGPGLQRTVALDKVPDLCGGFECTYRVLRDTRQNGPGKVGDPPAWYETKFNDLVRGNDGNFFRFAEVYAAFGLYGDQHRNPRASITWDIVGPGQVEFTSHVTDPDNDAIDTYFWDVSGLPIGDYVGPNLPTITHTFVRQPNCCHAVLEVLDSAGGAGRASDVNAGPQLHVVDITADPSTPAPGQEFDLRVRVRNPGIFPTDFVRSVSTPDIVPAGRAELVAQPAQQGGLDSLAETTLVYRMRALTAGPVSITPFPQWMVTGECCWLTATVRKTHAMTIGTPLLTVDVSLPGEPDRKLDVDQETTARITVEASNLAPGPFTNIAFTGAPLTVSPVGRVTIEGPPTPAIPATFSLAPGAERSFDVPIKGGVPGLGGLIASITGRDSANQLVSHSDELRFEVETDALLVEISADPNDFKLEETDEGPTPRKVKVEVKLTNQSEEDIENIRLPGKLDLLSREKPDPEPFPLVQLPPTATDRTIASLPAHSPPKIETYELEARDDGLFTVKTLVTFEQPDGGTGRIPVQTNVDVGAKTLLNFKAKVVTGEPWRAGETIELRGFVENRSTTKKIELEPLFAELTGNVGGGSLIPLGTAPECDCQLPLVGDLRPLQKLEWKTKILTAADNGTRGEIRFNPTGRVLVDGEWEDLTPDQIRVEDDSCTSPPGSTGSTSTCEIILPLDDSVAVPEPGNLATWAANLAVGAFEGALEFIPMLPGMIEQIPFLIGKGTYDLLSGTFKLAHVSLVTMDYMQTAIKSLRDEPGEWEAFVKDVTAVYDAEFLKAFGITKVQAAGIVDNALTQLFVPFADAWQSGDYDKAAKLLGKAGGGIAGPDKLLKFAKVTARVGEMMLVRPALQKTIRLAEKLPPGGLSGKFVPPALKALKPGEILSFKGMEEKFGLARAEFQRLAQIAKEKGLLLTVRFRNPESLRWLEPPNFAVLKPEAIKIKNVDSVDIKFLGYRENDLGSVVFKEPMSKAQLDTALVGATDRERKLATARWRKRVDEWGNQDGAKMRKYSETGQVDVGFNYKDNGIGSDIRSTVHDYRGFELRPVRSPDGTEYYVAFMHDEHKVLRRVTGDVDVVDIRKADGMPLTPAERADMYDVLQKLGMQHPETVSWVEDAADFWAKKAGMLADHFRGGEPALQIAPDGLGRAVYMNPALTFFAEATQESFVWWEGGFRTLNSNAYSFGARLFGGALAPESWVPPNKWKLKGPKGTPTGPTPKTQPKASAQGFTAAAATGYETDGLGKCTWRFANEHDAQILRPDDSGGLKRYASDGTWKPTDWAARCVDGDGGDLALTPQTSLSDDVTAGATRVPINELAFFAPEAKDGPWFEVGQRVVIDPGGEHQEVVTVTGFGSLILDRPLRYAHQGGEMVVALPPGAPAPERPSPQVEGREGTDDGPAGALPLTGIDLLRLVLVAVALSGLGVAAVAAGRRRGAPTA